MADAAGEAFDKVAKMLGLERLMHLERFRLDLWRVGYFRNIEVIEDRHLEESPPRVDLDVPRSAAMAEPARRARLSSRSMSARMRST